MRIELKCVLSVFFVTLFVFAAASTTYAVTYTTIAGTPGSPALWSATSTWSGGNVPPSTLPDGDTINIRHTVSYDEGKPIINHGTFRIEGATGHLLIPTNINVENWATKVGGQGWYIINGARMFQCRFAPAPSDPPDPFCDDNNGGQYDGNNPGNPKLSGTFKNIGGYVEMRLADVEVAQDWISVDGGERLMINSCLRTGQNYSISGKGSSDTIIGSQISIGWHGSGNFALADGEISFLGTTIQLAGTSGSFQLNSGTANGSIAYITLRNHAANDPGPFVGTGEIFASPSLNTTAPGINLAAYCVSNFNPGEKYKPNGKFTGAQAQDCSIIISTNECIAATPTAGEVFVEGRVMAANGRGIKGALVTIQGGSLSQPKSVSTNAFGYYKFNDLDAGSSYFLTVASKTHRFSNSTLVIMLNDSLSGADFTADPPVGGLKNRYK